jgi:hypothetical protein
MAIVIASYRSAKPSREGQWRAADASSLSPSISLSPPGGTSLSPSYQTVRYRAQGRIMPSTQPKKTPVKRRYAVLD